MKYIVYLTKNKESKINGINRIYVGVHKTENPKVFDGYIGCGVKIQQASSYMNPKSPFQYAVKKYGVKAFERITLFVFDTPEEAYQKEHDIVTEEFINSPHVYNVAIGGEYENRYKPLYQFDFQGNLVKKWESSEECYDFYGYPASRFCGPKRNKCAFLDSYWSTSPTINISEYSNKNVISTVYLYSKEGKLLREFMTQAECARYIQYDKGELSRAIKYQNLIKKQYYISDKLVDQFIPKPRKQYITQTFYVYCKDNTYIGEFHGKELMNVIDLHSWDYISNIFSHNNGWYKDFYISLNKIEKVPNKRIGRGISIDIYDKYGNFIEHMDSIKAVREKYNVPSSKIKNIQQGDRYFGNYIFKYSK